VKKWVKELKNMLGQDITFVIAGNKFDLIRSKEDLAKNDEMVNKYINEEKARHFYTSAKSGENLNEAFEAVIELTLNKIGNLIEKGKVTKKGKGLMIESNTSPKKKDGCC
jgi:Ras-related protein Rab-21